MKKIWERTTLEKGEEKAPTDSVHIPPQELPKTLAALAGATLLLTASEQARRRLRATGASQRQADSDLRAQAAVRQARAAARIVVCEQEGGARPG